MSKLGAARHQVGKSRTGFGVNRQPSSAVKVRQTNHVNQEFPSNHTYNLIRKPYQTSHGWSFVLSYIKFLGVVLCGYQMEGGQVEVRPTLWHPLPRCNGCIQIYLRHNSRSVGQYKVCVNWINVNDKIAHQKDFSTLRL